jgi:hypothetical protein
MIMNHETPQAEVVPLAIWATPAQATLLKEEYKEYPDI